MKSNNFLKHLTTTHYIIFTLLIFNCGCTATTKDNEVLPQLLVSENHRYLEYQDGSPFFWLGDTSWGMSEWLNKEDVNEYLDQRQAQGFNLLQICLFWGKREDDPVKFTTNPENAYGHHAFVTTDDKVDPLQPHILDGGSADNPNDYWDMVDYIVRAAANRNIILAILPVWGRRYVNASQSEFSAEIFDQESMHAYGKFLGERYKAEDHIIWVMGGDVKATQGGNYLAHYRAMAEGILNGVCNETIAWNENSPLWDKVLMTYHPDGSSFENSSDWFHHDAWLDFNMIETFTNTHDVYKAVMDDYALNNPIKPTVMGEPGYEGFPIKGTDQVIDAVQIRRQAYQSMFAGAAGFTYGGFRDSLNNGPLFSPYKGWQQMMNMEGALAMEKLKQFCLDHQWPNWKPIQGIVNQEEDKGELQKVSARVKESEKLFIYFPDSSSTSLNISQFFVSSSHIDQQWYNPDDGNYTSNEVIDKNKENVSIQIPTGWKDAVLILDGK